MTNTKTSADEASKSATPSLTQQIAELPVGQSLSFAERLDGDSATKEAIQAARKRLENIINAPVYRISKRLGQTYRVEVVKSHTRSLDVLVVLVLTRVA